MTRGGGTRTYYEILGVAEDATEQQIRDAYRARARTVHPDTGGSTVDMAAINSAYRVLQSPHRRATYDAVLARDRAAATAGGDQDAGTTEPPPTSSPTWGRSTGWGDPSGSSRAGRGQRRPAPPRPDRRRPPSPGSEFPRGRRAGFDPVLDVDPARLSWHPVDEAVSVVAGPPRWFPRQRRTRILAGALLLWALWVALAVFSGSWVLVPWLVAWTIALFLSRSGCIGVGLYIAAGLTGFGLAVVLQGGVPDDPSLRVAQAWLVTGMVVYFVAGAAWRQPAQPLPRYLPIPEAGIQEYFRWGHVEPTDVGATAGARQATALTCQLIDMLRTRLPGLRMAVRVQTTRGRPVPHVLVCGRRIALVYSVLGLTGDYRWDRGALAYIAPTGATNPLLNSPGSDLADMRTLFPEADVRTWVVVHPAGNAKPNVLIHGQPRGVRVAWAQDFLEEVGSWFAGGSPTTVRQDLLTRLVHATV